MKTLGEFISYLKRRGLEAIGLYYGTYMGIVSDNDDILNMGRVKLIIPEIWKNQEHPMWALPKGQAHFIRAGVTIPIRAGDQVWVEFRMGNKYHPVYSLGNGNQDYPVEDRDIFCWELKTRAGHKVSIPDTNDDKPILIQHFDGHAISIKSNIISIRLNDDTDAVIDNNGITLNHKKYKVAISDSQLSAGSDSDNILLKDGSIELKSKNLKLLGGTNGGTIISSKITGEINTLVKDINNLKSILSSWVPPTGAPDSGAALKAAVTKWAADIVLDVVSANIENPDIKH